MSQIDTGGGRPSYDEILNGIIEGASIRLEDDLVYAAPETQRAQIRRRIREAVEETLAAEYLGLPR